MARNSIGTLAVQVQADTSQFVAGMANATRRTEQFTTATQRMRTSVAAAGAAFKAPGLGRGAAFGGAASGVAGALGIGSLAGGVAGIAATGAFLLIDGLVTRERQLAEAAKATRQAMLDRNEAIRAGLIAAVSIYERAENALETNPAQRRVNAIRENAQSQRAPLEARLEELRTQIADRNTSVFDRALLNEEKQRNIETQYEIDQREKRALEQERQRNAARGLAFMAGQGIEGIRGVFEPIVRSISNDVQARIQANDNLIKIAERQEERDKALIESLLGFTREMQRDFGNLSSSVGRIGNQVDYFARKRH